MFDVSAYAEHLRYTGPLQPTLTTLREIHKRHLMRVPFDNARHAHKGLKVWDEVETDRDVLFRSVIAARRGGVCHELSGLFRSLLQELGFDVHILSAGIRGADDRFGPDLEHMLNAVRIGGEVYLVDVGFVGPSFLEPLRVTSEVQEQYGFSFRVVSEGRYQVVQRRGAAGVWRSVYRFIDRPRELADWKGFSSTVEKDMEWFWEGEQLSAGTLIRGRSFDRGQRILIGRRYLVSENGTEQVRAIIDKTEYEALVEDILQPDD